MDDGVHEMLLGSSLEEEVAAWTVSFKKRKRKSKQTKMKRNLDAGLRNQLTMQGFSY